jgi:sugar lactone lactonase YvrE
MNGLRFAAKTNYLYYTSTTLRIFMRVRVDLVTHDPVGEPEYVAGGPQSDDFCIDEDAGYAYLATHRENVIHRVSLAPGENGGVLRSVAGKPLNDLLRGPSSAAWGGVPGITGKWPTSRAMEA